MPSRPAEAPFAVQSWHLKKGVWFNWSAHATVEEAVKHARGLASERTRPFRIFDRINNDQIILCEFCERWHIIKFHGWCLL